MFALFAHNLLCEVNTGILIRTVLSVNYYLRLKNMGNSKVGQQGQNDAVPFKQRDRHKITAQELYRAF